MILLIIDELNNIEKNFGMINKNKISKIVDFSKKYNFDCLGFIDLELDTIFNEEQMRIIKRELEILQKNKIVDQNTINLINESVDFGISENYLYLRFHNEELNRQYK